jgi:polysaccharide export outer membrane protein
LVQHGVTTTGYQLLPGDRVYVKAEHAFRVDGYLQKLITPIERVLGITLLGASTYNQVKNRGLGGNNSQ